MNTIANFRPIVDLVGNSPISDGGKQTISWCLGQLPALYGKFGENHDIYYSDRIAHLEQGLLKELRADASAEKLTKNVLAKLKVLHAKHGLQSLDPRPVKSKK
jgi:hypothetical protein